MFRFASDELRGDPDVARCSLENNIGMYSCISPQLKANRFFIMDLFKNLDHLKVDNLVKHLHPDLRKDREVMLEATRCCAQALKSAHGSLKANLEFVLSAIRSSPSPALTWSCVPVKLQRKIDVENSVSDSYRSLSECLGRMPDFDTIMRDASADLVGEYRRGLHATRLNPVALQREADRSRKLFGDAAEFLVSKDMEHHRDLYRRYFASLKEEASRFIPEQTLPGPRRSRSRSPRLR